MDQDEEELTGHDYMTRPLLELQGHPNFNQMAYRVTIEVKSMTTRELELLSYSMFI